MVSTLILIGLAGIALTTGVLGGRGKKLKKIFDITKGPVSEFFIGMGGGAVINKLDNQFGNGRLQNLRIGSPAKGQNLNATDAILMAGTTGFALEKKTLRRFGTILAGKKVGEFFGLIDPAESTMDVQGRGSLINSGVRT